MLLSSIVYYLASASVILFYGIGISRTVSARHDFSVAILSCIKALSIASASSAISFLCVRWILSPSHLFELYPFVATFVFLFLTILIEIFLDVGIKKSPAEFSVTLLSVILSLGESISVAHAVVIACTCVCSFYLFLLLFHAIRDRAAFYSDPTGIKVYPVLILSLAVVMLAICGVNASYFSAL